MKDESVSGAKENWGKRIRAGLLRHGFSLIGCHKFRYRLRRETKTTTMANRWVIRSAQINAHTSTLRVNTATRGVNKLCAAWHLEGLDRLDWFRFDSVAVWAEGGEQG